MPQDSKHLHDVPFAVISSFGQPRGRDRVALRLCQHLQQVGARVTALADGACDPTALPRGLPVEQLPAGEELGAWIDRNQIQALLFVEFPEHADAAQWARWSESANRFVYTAWERLDESGYEELRAFDGVITAHDALTQRLKAFDLPSIPFSWGWSPPHPKPPLADDEPISLLHIAGCGEGMLRKASDKVFAAFQELAADTRFRCRLTSPEPLDATLDTQLREAGVHVDVGHLPSARIEALQRAARLVVLPSRWEGIGLPILEALSAGTPVITTDGAPMNLWVQNRREGLYVPSVEGSHEGVGVPTREIEVSDLVATIQTLADDRELLATLEKKALQGGAKRLSHGAAAEQFATALFDVLRV